MNATIEANETVVLTEEWDAVVEQIVDDAVHVAGVVDGDLFRHIYNRSQFTNPESICARMPLKLRVQYVVATHSLKPKKIC